MYIIGVIFVSRRMRTRNFNGEFILKTQGKNNQGSQINSTSSLAWFSCSFKFYHNLLKMLVSQIPIICTGSSTLHALLAENYWLPAVYYVCAYTKRDVGL